MGHYPAPVGDRPPLPTRVEELPPLPEDYAAALAAGLPTIPGLTISAAVRHALDSQVRLLLAWNESINLSGIRAAEAMAREHVLDSLAGVPLLRRLGVDEYVDLGSGAGYPGLALALALPASRALLVESVAKKARFLEAAVAAAGADGWVAVEAIRAEDLAANRKHREAWPAVVARALAPLPELAELALPLLGIGGKLVAWKRRPLDAELAAVEKALAQLGGKLVAVEAVAVPGIEDHVLVVLEKTRATGAQYPRPPAVRRRRPL